MDELNTRELSILYTLTMIAAADYPNGEITADDGVRVTLDEYSKLMVKLEYMIQKLG